MACAYEAGAMASPGAGAGGAPPAYLPAGTPRALGVSVCTATAPGAKGQRLGEVIPETPREIPTGKILLKIELPVLASACGLPVRRRRPKSALLLRMVSGGILCFALIRIFF